MKRILLLLLAFTLAFSFFAFAEGEISITVNSNPLTMDVPPEIMNGRTMVPMRAVFEALGADVNWIGEEQMIIATSGNKIIVLKIGASILNYCDVSTQENKNITLDVAPLIKEGRTQIPLRAVSEALGANVDWNGETRAITITK